MRNQSRLADTGAASEDDYTELVCSQLHTMEIRFWREHSAFRRKPRRLIRYRTFQAAEDQTGQIRCPVSWQTHLSPLWTKSFKLLATNALTQSTCIEAIVAEPPGGSTGRGPH